MRRSRRRALRLQCPPLLRLAGLVPAAIGYSLFPATAAAGEPWHRQIDSVLEEVRVLPEAPPADDAEFLRRAWIILAGEVPSPTEARAFFADTAPDKRSRLVESLLGSREFVRHFATWLDVLLMERRAEKHTKAAEWRAFLEESVAVNKPWTQLISEILTADGGDEKSRHVARWLLEREAESHLLARDVGRLFLGRDMACAQCHDHPRIDDYSQRDYHGMLAFVGRTYLFQPDMTKPGPGWVGERADGETTWTSVFTKVGGSTRPRLPDGPELDEPSIPAGEKWTVPPNEKDKNVRPIPKFSRRAQLAAELAGGQSPALRRNLANRLWAFAMGRGLVEPADLAHSLNPPVYSKLLDLLGNAVADLKFDMRAILREIALTRAFQDGFDGGVAGPEVPARIAAQLPAWRAESEKLEAAVQSAEAAFSTARKEAEETRRGAELVLTEWRKTLATAGEARRAADAAANAWKKSEADVASRQEVLRALADASKSAEAACKATPQDTELVTVVKTFQARSDKAAAEIAAAEKDLAAKKSEADAKIKSVADADQAAETKRPAAADAGKRIESAQEKLTQYDTAKQVGRVAAREAAGHVAEAVAVISLSEAAAATRAAEDAVRGASAAAEAGREQVTRLKVEIAKREQELPAAEKAAAESLIVAGTARQALEARRETLRVMADAAAKATTAAQKLPGEADVQNAAALIKNRAEQSARDVAEDEKRVAGNTALAEREASRGVELKNALTQARNELASAERRIPVLDNEAAGLRAKAAETASREAQAREQWVTLASDRFAIARLTPLTPEEFCWCAMKATGFLDSQRAGAAGEWDQKNPQTDADKSDAAKKEARAVAIEKLLQPKVKDHEAHFVRLFGNSAGQPQADFFATVDQALYFENAGTLRSWCQPGGENLSARLGKLPDAAAIADELYVSVLTRKPSETETAEVAQVLASRPPEQKPAVVADLVWGLLTSTEFRFRH